MGKKAKKKSAKDSEASAPPSEADGSDAWERPTELQKFGEAQGLACRDQCAGLQTGARREAARV